jgi:DNA ligase (NAD+)
MKVTYDSKQVADLAEEILRHKKLYYAGTPEIADSAYDQLEDKLKRLVPEHPALQKVGTEPVSNLPKVPHDRPLLSLQKTYDLQELHSWMDGKPVVGTIKVDGNSLSIVYQKGVLDVGKTRGNGLIGEDVTAKVRWVSDILQRLSITDKIEVRGELYCTESQFMRLSESMVELGFDRPTSPRNIVAGLLGRKGNAELMRFINFFAFDAVVYEGVLTFKTEMEKFAWLAKQGFNLPMHERLVTPAGVDAYLERTKKLLEEDEIGLDGAVFTYDDLALHEELGNTSHHPRYKMSFKWQGQTAQAKIKKVTWATSRLGVVTPVAVIEPVFLSGAKITNITLHNAANVKAYNLKSGDVIEIVRSGEVIPKFLQVVTAAAGEYLWPQQCPACSANLLFDDVRLKCPNVQSCPAQQLGTIVNWIRSAEIDDLSEKRVVHLIDAGLVTSMVDLYKLSVEDFYKLPQTKEKMATKLHGNIQRSRTLPLARFFNGLGIEGVGLTSWEKLLTFFPTLEAMLAANASDIQAVEGFAEKSATQIVNGLKEHRTLIQELLSAGVTPTAPTTNHQNAEGGALFGKTIVITGALSRPRDEVEAVIKAAGGKLGSAVSKNTFAVVTEDPNIDSSKMRKARELGVQTWSEVDLMKAIGV